MLDGVLQCLGYLLQPCADLWTQGHHFTSPPLVSKALRPWQVGKWLSFLGSALALSVMTAISVGIGYAFRSVPDALKSSLPIGQYLGVTLMVYFGVKTLRARHHALSTAWCQLANGAVPGGLADGLLWREDAAGAPPCAVYCLLRLASGGSCTCSSTCLLTAQTGGPLGCGVLLTLDAGAGRLAHAQQSRWRGRR